MSPVSALAASLLLAWACAQAPGAADPPPPVLRPRPHPQGAAEPDQRLRPYLEVLRRHGVEPVRYVNSALDRYDLVVFDDALHPTVEPFDFYRRLIRDRDFQRHAPMIFLELIPSNKQRHLEVYLAAPENDPRLLYPAFQDNANGLGFTFQTYFDLLKTVREVNQTLPAGRRLQVIGVGGPTYWSEIRTPRDLEQYYKATAVYDYHM